MHSSPDKQSASVKSLASALGFDFCGIAKAVRLDDDARRLERWLQQGMHGQMAYMERNFEARIDPTVLVPGAKSVITLLLNYFPEEKPQENAPRISRYAWGHDYHDVIRDKLNELLHRLRAEIGEIQGRGFVDSAPVLERSWAQRSGLGWIGKNGNLIHKGTGSWHFIATLITDLELAYDDPIAKDYCGNCRRCIEACPTDAIGEDKVINGAACISYFTIELKDAIIPSEMQGKFDNWVFGCDVCQEVCPWNRFAKPHQEEAFRPLPGLLKLSTMEWESMTEDVFRKMFKKSAIGRAKHKGMMRNLKFMKLS